VPDASAGPKTPKLIAPKLGRLDTVEPAELGPAEMRSDERYVDADFGERDLGSTSFVGCSFERVRMTDPVLRGAQFAECAFADLDAPVLSAPRSSWRSTTVTSSRIGSGEAYESTWRSVLIEGSKINYLNVRSAEWRDVVLRDCVIDELDLSYASVTRLAVERCRIGTLDVSHATLVDVDLRGASLSTVNGLDGLAGAWINQTQLLELAPLIAGHLGIRIASES
jgi:uncharacterized protein YjbI with pentapeptide repeats